MTKKELLIKLEGIINGEDIILRRKNNVSTLIPIDEFIDMFTGCELNYKSLKTAATDIGGWVDVFDEWKQQGILN